MRMAMSATAVRDFVEQFAERRGFATAHRDHAVEKISHAAHHDAGDRKEKQELGQRQPLCRGQRQSGPDAAGHARQRNNVRRYVFGR